MEHALATPARGEVGRQRPNPRRASAPAPSVRPVDPIAARAPSPGPALQRCACGGGCPACRAKAAGLAALPIHPANDVYEREADRVADAVMRGGPAPSGTTAPALPSISRLQRSASGPDAGGSACVAPPIVHEVLRSSGEPLDVASRAFFEPRFGRGFGDVRVHTNPRAAESARAVDAVAYTVGSSLVFGAGAYRPESAAGRRLIAHELTHVVQQTGGGAGAAVQRAMEVHDPTAAPANAPAGTTHESIVRDYIHSLCSSFTVTAGRVVPVSNDFCTAGVGASALPESCGCLCEMHNARQRTWLDELRDLWRVGPATGPPDVWTIRVSDDEWPHTSQSAREVTVHSPFSGVRFGAWTGGAAPHRMREPNWLVLGHELCGHARLMVRATHPRGPAATHGGRPSHDPTVTVENAISAEHGTPASELRGMFADPHHGESFGHIRVERFPTDSASVAALPTAEREKLKTADRFINMGGIRMDVIGHADQRGTDNVNLSRRRAEAVRDDLVGRPSPSDIDPAQFLVTRGEGSTECTAPGDQPTCRAVDIYMFQQEGASESHPAP